ncbi:glycosyltransferase [Streptomyces sp. B-S-A8]|uniref:Glycosyltransferase n=1 Tax=Streptomyces solicavernae TaxID=3043614 RepID=A0ABT6RVL3_9ACTN|nr:glycosyltransferase [Streptomyces sp. B-S-A8]MDI3388468.1 glycosyltransferase [Streptomyces sp. B-S-A8]
MQSEFAATGHKFKAFHILQPEGGGVPRVVADLVREQLQAGMDAVVACHPGLSSAGDLRAAGAHVLPWRATRSPGPRLASEVRAVARMVQTCRPDVVHAHSAKAGVAARLALRGRVPTVFQPHAWSFSAVEGTMAAATLRWERFAARWCDRIVCVSAAERNEGQAAGIAARWDVIPNGVDLSRFGPAPGSGERRRPPLVVCVGRLCRQKGQDVLLRAWPEVLGAVPDARLALVGDGPLRSRWEATAPARVEFVGGVADVLPWLHRADLLVLPSRWEGMALAPLEAMATALPVVVTDVNGARESLPTGHRDVALVPPEDPRALARSVATLLADAPLRVAMGRQVFSHAQESFDVRRAAQAVMDVYRRVTPPAPAARERQPV